MFGKNQYVVKRDDGRAVCREGNNQDPSHHPTQKDAYDAAREIAITQKCEVIIPGRDSKIRDNNSFENVPCSPRDKIYFFVMDKIKKLIKLKPLTIGVTGGILIVESLSPSCKIEDDGKSKCEPYHKTQHYEEKIIHPSGNNLYFGTVASTTSALVPSIISKFNL